MLKLLSDDHYLCYGLQHLLHEATTVVDTVLHVIDVDAAGGCDNIKKYLLSEEVSSTDKFFILNRNGYLSQHFSERYTVPLKLSLSDLHYSLRQNHCWVSYDELSQRIDFIISRFGLSPQQHHIITLLGQGWTPLRISKKLHISKKTLYTHMNRAKQNYGVRTHAELLHFIKHYC